MLNISGQGPAKGDTQRSPNAREIRVGLSSIVVVAVGALWVVSETRNITRCSSEWPTGSEYLLAGGDAVNNNKEKIMTISVMLDMLHVSDKPSSLVLR